MAVTTCPYLTLFSRANCHLRCLKGENGRHEDGVENVVDELERMSIYLTFRRWMLKIYVM
jgi:hypothetical protein